MDSLVGYGSDEENEIERYANHRSVSTRVLDLLWIIRLY